MYTAICDNQAVDTAEGVAFQMLQQSPVVAQATLTNAGSNIIGYRFQQNSAGTWSDIQTLGNPLNNTLVPGQTRSVSVDSSYPQVRCLALATGGSTLNFGVSRFSRRPVGGVIPLLNY